MALLQNALFEHSMHFQYSFLDCKAHLKAYTLFIRKTQIVTGTAVNTYWEGTQSIMAAKSDTAAPSDRKLYYL